ncbi:SusC/RagA family TonB-linked outer membrane protein [Salinimicrobium sp. WS361]|uniref:SusC/RagA family TonB-linked outer membrane protein n=1 Tax=Salinimicrobium sp. WS361 TaxID=3425123 RepID=UPI003D6FF941
MLFIFSALFSIHANTSYSQQQNVSLDLDNVTIERLIDEIESRTDFRFVYKTADVDLDRIISVKVERKLVKNVLEQIFFNTRTNFTIINEQILLTAKEAAESTPETRPSNSKEPLQSIVSGRILNEMGNPFPGVNVILKGSGRGVISDLEGEYRIAAQQQDTLVFQHIGYKIQEIPVNNQIQINVTMEQEIGELSEVIITGIFERDPNSFSGSAVTVTSEELRRRGNANVFQALQNIDPSIVIMENFDLGSNPNALPDMQIRGSSTFPADNQTQGFKGNYLKNPNQPLFILNGFEVSVERIFDLDFNRINRLTVLKDAASKAMYGSKAANGVVVIETDAISGEETRITYTANFDVQLPDLSSYNLTNSLEKLEAETLDGYYLSRNADDYIQLQQLYNARLKLAKEGLNTDWMAIPLRNAIGTRHSLGVELGGDNLRILANLNYQHEPGVMKGSYRENIGGSLTAMYNVENLKFRNITTVIGNKGQESSYGEFNEYAMMNPYWRARSLDGSIPYYSEVLDEDAGIVFTNPLYNSTLDLKNESGYLNLINNFYMEWQIAPSIKSITRIGIDLKRSDADEFYPAGHTMFDTYTDTERKGSYQVNNGKSSYFSADQNFQYSRNISEHFIFFNAGLNISENKYNEVQHLAEGFPSSRLNNITFARAYALDSRPTGISGLSRELGFLGVGSYVYDNRFLSDVTIRTSASSQFGADKRWSTFWSLGLGWNLHNEEFLKDSFVSQLKIRGSLGSTGNQNFNVNQSIITYAYYQDKFYQGFPGSYLLKMGNPDLQWETKFDYNGGIDAKIGNFNLKLDYYQSYTENLISDITLPYSTGFNSVKENLGRVKNTGIDANASYLVWSQGNNFINLNFGIATNKNEIVELSNALKSFNERQNEIAADTENNKPVLKYEDGMSMDAIWAVPSKGIDPATGREIFVKRDGSLTYEWDADDMKVVGNNNPEYRGIFGVSGEYEGFGLSVTARYLGGGQIYNQTLVDKVENVDMNYNVDRRVLTGRWQYQGQETRFKGLRVYDYERGMYTFVNEMTRPTSRFVQDRRELDLAAINAYYEFKENVTDMLRIERLRLSFNMNNVVKFSSIEIERGTLYPFSRTMSFSLTTNF